MSTADDPRLPVADPPVTAPEPEYEPAEPDTEQEEGDAGAETEQEGEPIDEGDGQPPKADGEPSPDTVRRREQRQQAADRLKAQNDRLRAENNELRARTAGVRPEDVDGAVERIIGKPPKEEEYRGDYLAYERALTAYELDKRQTTREVRRQVQSQESMRAAQLRDVAEAHQERVEDFKARTPDFDAVMAEANRLELKASPALEEMILESENSGHLVYFLGRNPQVLDDLNNMTDRQAARAIGTIESRLSLPNNPRTQTRAPAIIRPLTGGAAPSSPDREVDAYIMRKYPGRR
jgi:hypothetical protein